MPIKTDTDKVMEQIRQAEYLALATLYADRIDEKQEVGFLNIRGQEVPDPTVMEPPLGYVPGPDLMDQMRAMIRTEMSRIAEANEHETFEEADDFEVDDDYDPQSPYEQYFDPQPGEPTGPPSEPPTPPGEPKEEPSSAPTSTE